MGRPKGGKNSKWTNEERLKYVIMCEENHIPVCQAARETGVSYGTLDSWIRRYRRGGAKALNPEKPHPGNRFAAIHTSKSISNEERLRLLVEKLQIENERLKKRCTVKGWYATRQVDR